MVKTGHAKITFNPASRMTCLFFSFHCAAKMLELSCNQPPTLDSRNLTEARSLTLHLNANAERKRCVTCLATLFRAHFGARQKRGERNCIENGTAPQFLTVWTDCRSERKQSAIMSSNFALSLLTNVPDATRAHPP